MKTLPPLASLYRDLPLNERINARSDEAYFRAMDKWMKHGCVPFLKKMVDNIYTETPMLTMLKSLR